MTVTTPSTPTAWSPDVVAFPPADVVPAAVVLQASTLVGAIEGDEPSVRCPYVAADGTPGFTAEGTEIATAEQQFSEVVITTGKIATVGRYSYETLTQPNAAQLVVDSLNRSVVTKADQAFLGNADDPLGLLNVDGVVDGGSLGSNLDPAIDAVSGIEADGGQATTIIASPDAWASVSKIKVDTTSAAPLLPAGNTATQRSLLGIPVAVTPAMPEGSLLVLDRSAVLLAQSQVRVARSEHAYFTSDTIAVRVAWRLGWSVMHPARVAKLSTTPPE